MDRNSRKVKWKEKNIEYTSVVMLLNGGWALPCFAKALIEPNFLNVNFYVSGIRLLKIYFKCQNGILLSREISAKIRNQTRFFFILLLSLKTCFWKNYEKIFGNNGTRLTNSRSPNYSKKEEKKFIWIYYRYSKHNGALLFSRFTLSLSLCVC